MYKYTAFYEKIHNFSPLGPKNVAFCIAEDKIRKKIWRFATDLLPLQSFCEI